MIVPRDIQELACTALETVRADIGPELADLVDKKVIRILDAVIVTKHASGEVFSAAN